MSHNLPKNIAATDENRAPGLQRPSFARRLASCWFGACCAAMLLVAVPVHADDEKPADEAAASADAGAKKSPNPLKKVLGWTIMNAPLGWAAATCAAVSVLGAVVIWANSPESFTVLSRLPFEIPTWSWRTLSAFLWIHAAVVAGIAILFFVLPELPFVQKMFVEPDPPPAPAE